MDTSAMTAASNKFGLDLFKILFQSGEGNIFISPFSISVALAMTQLGAREKTAQVMAEGLRWPSPEAGATIHDQFRSYMSTLQAGSNRYQLSSANRIYIEKTYQVLQDFITSTQTNYLAEPVAANFIQDASTERQKINKWVEDQTQNKIQNLLAEGTLDPLTRMVLVNAIYFKGNWEEKFDERDTSPRPFKTSPGQTKDVQMMFSSRKFGYYEDQGLQCSVIDIPYQGGDLSMVIFLPREDFGLKDLVKNLTPDNLSAAISRVKGSFKQEVELFLPRFQIESGYGLKDPLTQMGMGEAFDMSRADFSGMTGSRDLFISAVVHKAFVKVNEQGTEAAAATAVVMALNCAMPRRKPKMIVDHPFLFSVVDKRANDVVLFLGHVEDISQ